MSLSAAALSEIDSTDSSSPSSSRSQSESTDSSDSDSSNTTSAISESPPPYTEFVDNPKVRQQNIKMHLKNNQAQQKNNRPLYRPQNSNQNPNQGNNQNPNQNNTNLNTVAQKLNRHMINEINFICNNLGFANADPSNFTFKQNLEWFKQLKEMQIKRGYNLFCFKKRNDPTISKKDFSLDAIHVFYNQLTRNYLSKYFTF